MSRKSGSPRAIGWVVQFVHDLAVNDMILCRDVKRSIPFEAVTQKIIDESIRRGEHMSWHAADRQRRKAVEILQERGSTPPVVALDDGIRIARSDADLREAAGRHTAQAMGHLRAVSRIRRMEAGMVVRELEALWLAEEGDPTA